MGEGGKGDSPLPEGKTYLKRGHHVGACVRGMAVRGHSCNGPDQVMDSAGLPNDIYINDKV